DENGGRWDHVAPPAANGPWGDGARVPGIVISPYAKQHFVDHTQHDTLSILKTIEDRFGLQPLTQYDANASSLSSSFEDRVIVGQSGGVLSVTGTLGADAIAVTRHGQTLSVTVNGQDFGSFNSNDVTTIRVDGAAGNDLIFLAPNVHQNAILTG